VHNRLPALPAARVAELFPSPVFGRSYMDDCGSRLIQEINGIMYRFSAAGDVVDAFRYSRPRHRMGEVHRSEIQHDRLAVKPLTITYDPTNVDAFFGVASLRDRQHYASLKGQMSTVYAVRREGVLLGLVVKTRFTDEQAGAKPRTQWLAMDAGGDVWMSYGRTREEAARHLLASYLRPAAADVEQAA